MSHEPECHMDFEYEFGCHCEEFRAAYKRGREDAAKDIEDFQKMPGFYRPTIYPDIARLGLTPARGGEQE